MYWCPMELISMHLLCDVHIFDDEEEDEEDDDDVEDEES